MTISIPAGDAGLPTAGASTHLRGLDMQWVSRYSRPTFVVDLYHDDLLVEPDGDMTVAMYAFDPDGLLMPPALWTEVVAPDPAGHYAKTLSSTQTAVLGFYEIQFTYTIDAMDEIVVFDIEVGPPAHDYDALEGDWKATVDAVWMRFADLFDSPFGGPNLQVYIQTHFGRNRLAQLLPTALQTLNTSTLGHSSHTVGDESFAFAEWGGLLQTSLYIEVLKHLIRSYTEQPEVILGTAVSRVDRRDYMQRWQEVLNGELETFNRDLSRYKMASLGLGNVHVLVSGGAFGKLGPYVNAGGAGEAAARGYFAVRRWH